MKKLFYIVFILLSFSITSEAKNLYVNNSGSPACSDSTTYANNDSDNPWCTVGRAAWGQSTRPDPWPGANKTEAADAGDIVIIVSGTYEYSGTYDSDGDFDRWNPLYQLVNADDAADYITFTTSGGDVTLTGNAAGEAPFIGGSSTDEYIKWDGGDNWIKISQSDIGYRYGNGIINTAADHTWIEKTDITGIYYDPDGPGDQHNAILMQGGDSTCSSGTINNITIRNNKLHGFTGAGRNDTAITMYCGGDNILIEHNEIYANANGIYAKSSNEFTPSSFIVRYNLFYSNTMDGIAMQAWTGWKVYQNIFRDNSGAAFHMEAFEYYAGDPKPSYTYIVNNTMDGNHQAFQVEGICADINNNYFKNNIITNATHGIFNEDAACETTENIGSDDIDFDYNVYQYSGVFWVNDEAGTVAAALSNFQSTYSQDGNSVDDVDPLYTNESGNDFTLQAGSPCREGQANDGVDILDLDGDSSTADAITIGAYITGEEVIGIESSAESDRPTISGVSIN